MSIQNEPRSKMGLPPHGFEGWMLAYIFTAPTASPNPVL